LLFDCTETGYLSGGEFAGY